ncbi:MAG: hypothetical protein PUB97_04775 [Ruminococcus sp.]|nr:hypothetical protein [Ruminococcus sp.]
MNNRENNKRRFRIRNVITGTYIHVTLFRLLEFSDRREAVLWIQRHGLRRDVYCVEETL